MQRDMELIRKVLFTIEDKYVDTWLGSNDILMSSRQAALQLLPLAEPYVSN